MHGELAMRPLVLREIADELGLHESTISRVTTAKYMATPFGTFELKYFFGSGLGTESGGNASSTAVRALIKQFVAAESPKKPLSDNQLSDMLKEQGIECARRTVAKYREGLRIAPASLKEILVNQLATIFPLRRRRGGLPGARGAAHHRLAAGLHHQAARRRGRAHLAGASHAAEPAQPPGPACAGAAVVTPNTAASRTCTAPPSEVAWERWFTPRESIKVEVTAQHSPLTSLNFAALKIKDAVCDRFRAVANGVRPDVNTQWPDVRIYAHLTTDSCSLYIDTSGEPLFKRGWREDKGDAPLKETLAAAMLAASGWSEGDADLLPLYDPCCGSGTIVIEAAQMACNIAAGSRRRFAFEKYVPFQKQVWEAIKQEALRPKWSRSPGQKPIIFGSDVAHRMVDFAQRNAAARRRGRCDRVSRRRRPAAHAAHRCEHHGRRRDAAEPTLWRAH